MNRLRMLRYFSVNNPKNRNDVHGENAFYHEVRKTDIIMST